MGPKSDSPAKIALPVLVRGWRGERGRALNEFQQACRSELDDAFAGVGLEAHHEVLDYDESAGRSDAQARYLRTQALHAGRFYDLYAYDAEAGAQIENNWYLFERRLFRDQEALVRALGRFVRGCLAGESPVDAYREAGQGRSAS